MKTPISVSFNCHKSNFLSSAEHAVIQGQFLDELFRGAENSESSLVRQDTFDWFGHSNTHTTGDIMPMGSQSLFCSTLALVSAHASNTKTKTKKVTACKNITN